MGGEERGRGEVGGEERGRGEVGGEERGRGEVGRMGASASASGCWQVSACTHSNYVYYTNSISHGIT